MAEVQIEKLADDIGISVDKLLQQFAALKLPSYVARYFYSAA